MWGFPNFGCTFFGGSSDSDYSMLGSIWGSPYLWNLPNIPVSSLEGPKGQTRNPLHRQRLLPRRSAAQRFPAKYEFGADIKRSPQTLTLEFCSSHGNPSKASGMAFKVLAYECSLYHSNAQASYVAT